MQPNHIVVFLGPTLPVDAAREILDAEYLPPAARGDVYRAAVGDPRAIVLIDGYFENSPSVFHKEILWALTRGIRVYGAASMGALRSAELGSFGMIGIGRIYESYRDGRLERDDAVAVLHGPAELGYPPLTVALVDMLATLSQAEREGVIEKPLRLHLEALASNLFYKERDYARLVEQAVAAGCASEALSVLTEWLEPNQVSQKARDCVAALKRVAADLEHSTERLRPSFYFEATVMWERLLSEVVGDADEHHQCLEFEALAHVLAGEEAKRGTVAVSEQDLIEVAHRFRSENRLWSPSDVQNWLERTGLSHEDYLAILDDMCLLEVVATRLAAEIDAKKRVLLCRRSALKAYPRAAATRDHS